MIIRVEKKNTHTHKTKGRLHQKGLKHINISINNNLYDACNECTYDTCSNAQKTCSILQHWLGPRVLTENPKFWKTHFSKPNQIDQLIITVVRKHHIMT